MNGNYGKQLAVLDRGFIYAGNVSVADGVVTIAQAQNVRRWGTSRGLGELAANGPLPDTVLDPAGTVTAPVGSLIHLLALDEAAWAATLGAAAPSAA